MKGKLGRQDSQKTNQYGDCLIFMYPKQTSVLLQTNKKITKNIIGYSFSLVKERMRLQMFHKGNFAVRLAKDMLILMRYFLDICHHS